MTSPPGANGSHDMRQPFASWEAMSINRAKELRARESRAGRPVFPAHFHAGVTGAGPPVGEGRVSAFEPNAKLVEPNATTIPTKPLLNQR